MPAETIDFRIERGRHEHFFGREDVLAAIDEHLAGAGATSGWVLVTGGPGMGKSAILSRWLDLQEQRGRKVPHHFLRRGVMDWDRPEAVVRSLSAQIEELYPAQRDPQVRPDSRLWELLARVSQHELVPRGERLVLVIDGLDEVRSDGAGHNPLPSFLPHVLPPGVHVLGALRPEYPYLSWLETRGNVRRIDLDEPAWSGSNDEACRGFWAYHAPRFATPLDRKLVAEAIARGQGNLLYAVKLCEWLQEQPADRRRAELLPRGLSGFLEQIWQQLLSLPEERFGLVADGLGLICAAQEALPLEEVEAAAAWRDLRAKEHFLQSARALLLEEPEQWRGVRAYRPYHESFRDFVAQKLGQRHMAEQHRRLLGTAAQWPVAEDGGDFRRRYAPRHVIAHAIAAGDREASRGLCRDVGLLEALCREGGPAALEGALREAAKELGDEEIALIHRAVMAESHWLRQAPEALPGLLWNRLRSAGWEARRINSALRFTAGRPMLRLRHPVRMWNGEERTLTGHSGWVMACAVSPDGQRIVSASSDKTLKVWDVATGELLSTLEGHSAVVNGCAVSPDGQCIVSASSDKTLKVWDVATGELLSTLEGHSGGVMACTVSPDGQRIVSASSDKTLKVWDVATGELLSTLEGHSAVVNGCAVSPDGQCIVSASSDKTLKVWDVATGKLLSTLEGHSGGVMACTVSPDGQCIVSASSDKTLKVWDVATGKLLSTLEGHSSWVIACAISPDGQCIVSASSDKTLKVWDVATGKLLSTLEGHSAVVNGFAISPDGQRIVSASSDETLKVWDVATGKLLSTLEGHSDWVMACAISPDGQRIVSASSDKTLKVWDVVTGKLLSTLEGHSGWVMACAVSPDGQRIVSASSDKTLKVWDVATGELLSTLESHSDWVIACAISPDGQRIVSASSDKTLKVWDVATGKLLSTLEGHSGAVMACAISPDSQRIVSASSDKTLKVWDVATGELLSTLEGHSDRVMACAVSPDGQRIVFASPDKTLKVWDVATGELLSTLEGHSGRVMACAVSPDGQRIVSASDDKTLKVWDLVTARCLMTAYGVSPFNCFVASDQFLCAGDAVGSLWFLELGSPSLTRPDRPIPRPIRLFFSYSDEDSIHRDALETHLAMLKREGILESWHDGRIAPGKEWADEIDRNLEEADVILLLVSSDFFASDLCEKQMSRAIERHHAGQARVIPVILRPVDWTRAPIAKLDSLPLPKDARPVTRWEDRDEAWTDVAAGIRRAVEALRSRAGM